MTKKYSPVGVDALEQFSDVGDHLGAQPGPGVYRGQANPMYGKHHSPESREKMSGKKRGKRYVNDGTTTRMVSPEEARDLVAQGWRPGRPK